MAYNWASLNGRSAEDINFENADEARQKRVAYNLAHPGDIQTVLPDPKWDAFWGGLDRAKDTAEANGLNFRVNLGGFGNDTTQEGPTMARMPDTRALYDQLAQYGGGLRYPSDVNANAVNAQMSQDASENGVRTLATDAAIDVQRQQALADMRRSYADQVEASMNAPPIDQPNISLATRPGSPSPVITMRPASTDPRTQFLDRLPPAARLQYEQQMAALDAQRTDTALKVQKERAAEASNPLITSPTLLTGPDGSPLQGPDVLKRLSPAVRNQVQGILEGRQAMPVGTATKDPYWKSIIQIAQAVDPSFDAVNYNARANTRKAFTSGKEAGQINAINTVIGHLTDLAGEGDKLGNGGMDWLNSLRNKLTLGGSARGVALNNFDALKEGVGNELMRVWRQVGAGSEKEIDDWKAQISAAKSPQELHGAFRTIASMLESKLSSLDDQYRQGMGTDAIHPVSQAARAKLDKLYGGMPSAPAAPASAGPTEGAQQPIPGVPGGVAAFRGGRWVRVQ